MIVKKQVVNKREVTNEEHTKKINPNGTQKVVTLRQIR